MPTPPLPAFATMLGPALLACAILAAQPAGAAPRDELVVGISQYPASLNPTTEYSVAQSVILHMAYRPFTVYDKDWKLLCLLCTGLPTAEAGTLRLEQRPDGTEGMAATFTIQAKAAWGDGTPVTTRDVLFTWEAGRDPRSGFIAHEVFSRDIIGITVQDDKTFTLHFRPDLRCQVEAINDFRILPAHLERPVWQADPTRYASRSTYVTNPVHPGLYHGPYRVTRAQNGAFAVLEPNPTWWGPAPHFKRIVIKAFENTSALEANLLSGQIDYIAGELGVTLDQALAIEQRHGKRFQVIYKPGLQHEHIDLNLDNPILGDVRVRRALLHAIDRDLISRQLFQGKQPVALTNVHPLDAYFTEDVPRYPFDPKRAGQLLDDAGWTRQGKGVRRNARGEALALDFVTTAGNRARELVQQALQAQWRDLGVETRIVNQPARVLFGSTLNHRKFTGLAMFAWLSSPENVPRSILHSTQIPSPENGWSGQNYPGLRDGEADKVIDALQVECEGEPRRRLWARIQRIYAEQLPALPLFFRSDAYIMPKWLHGVEPTGHQYGSSLWVENWRATEE